MIEPTTIESERWSQLWHHPRAAIWFQREQHLTVAALVRLEHRRWQSGSHARTSDTDLQLLLNDLGLDLWDLPPPICASAEPSPQDLDLR
jgi:hypothetical protein